MVRRRTPSSARPFERSKNVVQMLESSDKSPTKSEKRRRKRFASICCNLLLFSGLRRLRQDLVDLISRFEGRRSIQLSYGHAALSEFKAFYGVRRTLLISGSGSSRNAVSGRGRDPRSARHAGLVSFAKISLLLQCYRKSCRLSRAVIRSGDRHGG
jgi:hypothetical protein